MKGQSLPPRRGGEGTRLRDGTKDARPGRRWTRAGSRDSVIALAAGAGRGLDGVPLSLGPAPARPEFSAQTPSEWRFVLTFPGWREGSTAFHGFVSHFCFL